MITQACKDKYNKLKAEKEGLEKRLEEEREKLFQLERNLSSAEKALSIIQSVARATQQNITFHFSKIVTNALKSITQEWPEFEAEFVVRRNRTECDIYFVEGEARQHPKGSSGGGPKDVASFALRCAYWALKKNRRTFILDEPFKYVSPDLQEKTSEMVKQLSNQLGLQIIMVSHQEDINIAADRTYLNTKKGKKSRINLI